jgi:hypothetical protein
VVNSSLDNVNELLRLVCGDKPRLEDIQRRLENGQTLYNSDNNYLQQLVNQHGGEIQKIIGSTYLKPKHEPTHEPTPQLSNKMEKSITILFSISSVGVTAIALLFFIPIIQHYLT